MRKYVRAFLDRFCPCGEKRPFVEPGHKSRVKHEMSTQVSANAMREQSVAESLELKARERKLRTRNKARFNAQVTEWLMVADCKSAALRSYGGSNPPLCTRLFLS